MEDPRERLNGVDALKVRIKDEMNQKWILYIWHELPVDRSYVNTNVMNLGVCIPIIEGEQPLKIILDQYEKLRERNKGLICCNFDTFGQDKEFQAYITSNFNTEQCLNIGHKIMNCSWINNNDIPEEGDWNLWADEGEERLDHAKLDHVVA